MERNMAKGQKRSNREAKKPKKSVAEKQKAGAMSTLNQPARNGVKPPPRKV
jgi:hypothetical protein